MEERLFNFPQFERFKAYRVWVGHVLQKTGSYTCGFGSTAQRHPPLAFHVSWQLTESGPEKLFSQGWPRCACLLFPSLILQAGVCVISLPHGVPNTSSVTPIRQGLKDCASPWSRDLKCVSVEELWWWNWHKSKTSAGKDIWPEGWDAHIPSQKAWIQWDWTAINTS